MIVIAWCNRDGRNDVGANRTSRLLEQLKKRGVGCQVIDLWKPNDIYGKIKWVLRVSFLLIIAKRQLVYTSCNPYKHLLLLAFFSTIKRHKLVVDFRDAYSIDIKERNYPGSYIFARFTEKIVYKCCVKFIVVTPGIKKRYEKIFKDDSKIMVVPNGHELDREFLEQLHIRNKKNDGIRVVYPGMYSPYFFNDSGIQYIDRIKCELEKTGRRYEIIFVGTDKRTKELLKHKNNIKFIPDTDNSERLPYKETIEILNTADLVFMPIDNDYGCATKIYDYLALGLPIFNFIDKSNWLHEYIGERIVNNCENLSRFEMDYKGKYHRDNQMKTLVNYICEEEK